VPIIAPRSSLWPRTPPPNLSLLIRVTCHTPPGHMSQTIRSHVTPPPVTCHKPSGHMSQTIRSHVTNHPVTCHKPIASHRIPSHPIASHRIPSHPIASHRIPSFTHLISHFISHATHSFLFFILTTSQMREIHQNNQFLRNRC
jgi:hypothetical protein